MVEKIIMQDSPEAASIQTVTGWVSSKGHFWGDDERMARFDGSTHRRCECGAIVEQRSYCKNCYELKRISEWHDKPQVKWDGESYLYSQTYDTYFRDFESLADYCNDNECNPDDMMLIICKPNYLCEVDLVEDNYDDMPEDGDESCLPEEVWEILQELNKTIRKSRTPDKAISWSPGKTRPITGSIVVGGDT